MLRPVSGLHLRAEVISPSNQAKEEPGCDARPAGLWLDSFDQVASK
jgi:hypothetical protein